VPYNKYAQDPTILAAEVLREVPNQVTDFYRLIETSPKPPPDMHMSKFNVNQNYTRTGDVKDENYYNANQEECKTNVLGAFGQGSEDDKNLWAIMQGKQQKQQPNMANIGNFISQGNYPQGPTY